MPDPHQVTAQADQSLPRISFFAGLVQGGAEKQAVETAKLLHAKGHDVTFYCYNLKKAFYHPEDIIRVVDLKDYRTIWPETLDKVFSIFRLARIIRRDQPDFLISYTTLLNVLNGLIGLLNRGNQKTHFIGSERNSVLRYSNSALWKWICWVFYHGLDGLYANNTPAVEQLRRIVGFDAARSFLLPNLLDTEAFKRDEAATPFNPQCFTILIPARVCDQKNQTILVPVATELRDKGYKVQFILAGNPEAAYAAALQQKITDQQLADYFVWLGQHQQMRALYNRCDLTYLPSKYEGFSNSIIEAMACETLVMGSAIPAFTDVLQDGQTGFITDLNNPTLIAAKIQAIIGLSDAEKNKIRQQARAAVLAYGREGYYRNLTRILAEVFQR